MIQARSLYLDANPPRWRTRQLKLANPKAGQRVITVHGGGIDGEHTASVVPLVRFDTCGH